MAHGDRAKWNGNWRLDRCYMGRRPGNDSFCNSPRRPGRSKQPSTKTITHRMERRAAQRELRKELSDG